MATALATSAANWMNYELRLLIRKQTRDAQRKLAGNVTYKPKSRKSR